MRKIFTFYLFVITVLGSNAQALMPMSAPVPKPYSVFNYASEWHNASNIYGSSGSYVLVDLTGNGHDMIQQAGTLTLGTGVNSKPKLTGNSSAYLTSNLSITNFPITVVTVALRANNATCGFFGHTGASGFNTLWHGYEASNANTIYNTNASANTTSEAGSIAIYVAKIGYGSRQTWVNGVLQSNHTESSIAQSSAITTTIGTQYRGLNCDWYETLVFPFDLSLDDMDEVNTYINNRYGTSIVLWSSYSDIPLIVNSGQSNASGRGAKSYLQSNFPLYYSAQTGIKVWCDPLDYTSTTGTTWSTLDESAFNNDFGDGFGNVNFGYESSLGSNYINRVGGSVYIFKYSKGGTWLAKQAAAAYWQVDGSDAPNNGLRLYSPFMQNWTDALIALQAAHLNPKGVAIIWTQGEQDATDASASSLYQTNLTNFCNTIRSELGLDRRGVKTPIIITRLPNGQAGEPFLSTVQTAQTNTASALTNATLFNTDSYSFQAGNVHWDNASYVQIGIDLASIIGN